MVDNRRKIRLGILVPSSNTALEPLTNSLLHDINKTQNVFITAHFTRFPVTTISLSPSGLAQFDLTPIVEAAELLAQADVDIIGWSGTSAGWLGFKQDVELCEGIEKRTGIRATTSVLGLNKALGLWSVERLGLVTPYMDDVQRKIVQNYKEMGIKIGDGMERHLRVERNTDIADIEEDLIDQLVGEVVKAGDVQAVTTFCTNLVAAHRVYYWEEIYGVPVFDTVITVVWDMLRMCEADVSHTENWGMIFTK